MSRSGYIEDCEHWDMIRWRGAVASAIRGKRGQAFLLEMWKAMQALPERKLVAHTLESDGAVCAIGSVAKSRGMDISKFDIEDHEAIADAFGIAHSLPCEIMYLNDEWYFRGTEAPESRFIRMKEWIEKNLQPVEDQAA
jgi:hypothetical protein